MKICAVVFFALLVTQSSASLFDTIRGAFQPLGNCVGKLYNDVVSDLKQTIDCTVMAVEHAFSWKTMFGRNAEYYEEMCTGRKKNASKSFNDAYNVASKDISAKEQSVNQLENTIEKSPADAQERNIIEEAFVNETLRFQQIHKIIFEELNKLTDDVEKRMKTLDHDDVRSAETVLGEVKQLYEFEQLDRTSSRANEVRNTFDKVLSLLQVNDTGGAVYSDDEEVKVIMKGIGKSLGDAVDDVEKKFMEWKQENNKLQQTISKNITLEHNDNEVSSKQDKDGSKLKRQSATFHVSPLDTFSTAESQNKSDPTHSMDSQLIPILNPLDSQFPKKDQKEDRSQSADQTKESIQTSSKVAHHNSTDNHELSRLTSQSTNQSEINQDTLHTRLLQNNFENLEQRDSSLQLAEKIWNPGNHQVSNSTKYNQSLTKQKDSNTPEYTQLTLKGIQFQKAADILKSSQENQLNNQGTSNESPKTVRQSTTEKSQDISGDSDMRQGRDRFGDLPKDPNKGNGQLIQSNDTSFSHGISQQTNNNLMITNKVLEQNNQNQTANYTKDSHSTEASNEKAESGQVESNLSSDNSEENESLKISQTIRKMDNKSLEDNIKPVKELNYSQSSISKSSLKILHLNMSAAIADHSELKHENPQTQTVNQGSPKHSSQLEGANKTESVKPNSQPSNAKHNLDSKQANIQLLTTENYPEVIAENNQRLSVENNQYKNQTNGTSENQSKTTQDDSRLKNSTCLNQNSEIVQKSSRSLNVTEKMKLVQERNETVNTENTHTLPPIKKVIQANSKSLDTENKPTLKKENIHLHDSAPENSELVHEEQKDQLSSIKNKPDQTELKQQIVQCESAEKTPASTQGNIQLSMKKKSDIISENNQTVANPDWNHNSHAPSNSVVNLEARLEFNQNLVARNNSDFLQKESMSVMSSAQKTPMIIQKSSEPLNNQSNTELNKNNLVHVTGNYSEATQEITQPLNTSITKSVDLIKENDQSLIAQKPTLFPEILRKSEENPGFIVGNRKPLSRDNEPDNEASQPSTAENNEEKQHQYSVLNNPKIEEIYISESAEKLKQESIQHTNVKENADLIRETSQLSSVENHLQINEEYNGLSASENSNMTHKIKKLINCSQPVTLAVNQEDSQPVSIEKKVQNDKINPDLLKECSLPLNAENNKEMISESSDVKKSELTMAQEEGKRNQHKNRKNSESLNKNITTEFIEAGNLPYSSTEETQLNTYNSSEYMKSNQQSSQEIHNVPEKLTEDSVSDDKYKSQNNQDDTKLASAGINLSSEIGTKENKTLESPHEVSQESNNSDIPQMIKETTNSFNKPVSQITHSNGNNEMLNENLQSPQNNAADVSQQLRESSNLQTLAESTQLTQESNGSEVVQPPENRIEDSSLSSIMNSSEDEHVPSCTFNTFSADPVHSFEGQMIEDDSYVPSPRFSHVLNKQTTPLETEPGLVRDSTYSNQNQYVPNPKFNYPFDKSMYPTESLPDLAPGGQEGSDDTFSEIRSITNGDKQQHPLWGSFTQDYPSTASDFSTNFMSTEKPESYGLNTGPMFDIESIIQDSQRSESLMENLFSNMDHEHNVFGEPDMFYN